MNNYKRQALYNTVGNLVYMMSLWLISILCVRISGFEIAGLFSLAMSVGNIFFFIAVYGIRSFQASDSTFQYQPEEYFRVRWITTFGSLLLLAGYLAIVQYDGTRTVVILLFTVYKFFEACSDVFFGELQRVGHLEVCGFSMSLKGFLSVVTFCLVLYVTHDLNTALLSIVVIAALILFIIDVPQYHKFKQRKTEEPARNTVGLLKDGFPMLLTTVFPIVATAIPRLVLDKAYGEEMLGIYSSISTPTVLITTIVPNVLAPFMTYFGLCFHENRMHKLYKMLWTALACTMAFGLLACICALILGEPVMTLMFGEKIKEYLYILIPLIIATTVYAFTMVANSVLISIRQPVWLTLFAAAAFFVSLAVSTPMIGSLGLMGAVWAFGVPFAVQLVLQVTYLTKKLIV